MQVYTSEIVHIPSKGLSVKGIARKILEYMDTQDTTYPSEYSLEVASGSDIIITRRYTKVV